MVGLPDPGRLRADDEPLRRIAATEIPAASVIEMSGAASAYSGWACLSRQAGADLAKAVDVVCPATKGFEIGCRLQLAPYC